MELYLNLKAPHSQEMELQSDLLPCNNCRIRDAELTKNLIDGIPKSCQRFISCSCDRLPAAEFANSAAGEPNRMLSIDFAYASRRARMVQGSC